MCSYLKTRKISHPHTIMAKPINVYIYGSSHFASHHHQFEARFRDEWYTIEQTSQRQRFAAIHFKAVGGAKLDLAITNYMKHHMDYCSNNGWAQVHIVCLGDNNLREAIDRNKVEGAISEIQNIGNLVNGLAEHAKNIRDCQLFVYTPLPSPKFRRYNDMWERAAHTMKTRASEARSGQCVVRNITKCFWRTITNARGTITGWQIRGDLFAPDGVHLSVKGAERLIEELCLTLKSVPRFGFEREDRREVVFVPRFDFDREDLREVISRVRANERR